MWNGHGGPLLVPGGQQRHLAVVRACRFRHRHLGADGGALRQGTAGLSAWRLTLRLAACFRRRPLLSLVQVEQEAILPLKVDVGLLGHAGVDRHGTLEELEHQGTVLQRLEGRLLLVFFRTPLL